MFWDFEGTALIWLRGFPIQEPAELFLEILLREQHSWLLGN